MAAEGFFLHKNLPEGEWKQLWFVLEGHDLLRFSSDDKDAICIGKWNLDNCRLIENPKVNSHKPFVFQVDHNAEMHLLACPTLEDKEKWIKLIQPLVANDPQSLAASQSRKSLDSLLDGIEKKVPTSPSFYHQRGTKLQKVASEPLTDNRRSVINLPFTWNTIKQKEESVPIAFPPWWPTSTNPTDIDWDAIPKKHILGPKRRLILPPPPPPPEEEELVEPPPEPSKLDFDPETKEVKAGTVEKLIESLYASQISTPHYLTAFLLTYRSFATPHQVLQQLRATFEMLIQEDQDQIKKASLLRIVNFLKKWVSDNFQDFANDQSLINEFSDFVELINKRSSTLGHSLKAKLNEKLEGLTKVRVVMFNEAPPTPVLPKELSPDKMSFDELSPIEVARQLTLLEHGFYQAIQPHELLDSGWNKPDKEKRSPNLLRMTDFFNQFSKYVSLSVIRCPIKNRTSHYKKLIKIAEECQKLNNFHAVFEIIGGLMNSSVYRLKKTHEVLPNDINKTFQELKDLTAAQRSWKVYREVLKTINPPCVPFIGVTQTDLTFLDDGNPTKLSNGFVNFKKCLMFAKSIEEIQRYQQKPYNLSPVAQIQEFLVKAREEAREFSMDDLYSLSLQVEPRAAS